MPQSALTASPPLTPGINFAPGYHKVLIQNSSQAAITGAAKNGGVQLADYGSFSLWKLPDTPGLNNLTKNSAVEKHDEFDRIGLRDGEINTGQAVNDSALNSQATANSQLWLVQFVGPIKPEWLQNLQSLGVDPVMYMPSNAYVVWANGNQLKQLNGQAATGNTEIQWSGPYQAGYRLDPALKNRKNVSPSTQLTVTVQLYNTSKVQDSLTRLEKMGGKVVRSPSQILKFTDITLQVPSGQIEAISRWPDVFNVEQYAERVKLDEAQGQIVAGNVITNSGKVGPSAPGYLAWLTGLGFPTSPESYPIVDVVDDGIDNGTITPVHPDFYTLGNKATGTSRVVATANCTTDALADGTAGHGNLNSGIVGAYNNASGQPYVDSNGFNRGVGISPFGRLSHTKIFSNNGSYDISNCGNSDAGVVLKSYQNGASITSNSWGDNFSPGAYDASSQAYDSLTRDAAGAVPGNQQMLHVFAAGNDGPTAATLGTPGTAKNVLTVGATENVRDEGVSDGCGETNADNADDMAIFSSRGPTADGRIKPDLVAPGTHIQGPASQDPAGFDGTGVCGGSDSNYYPNPSEPFGQTSSQTLYTWSTGTSHSTPAVAGGMSLLYNYYSRTWGAGQYPSPAMAKALTLNSPRYLTGSDTGDTLPSNNQGWGDLNLGTLFDGVPRVLLDQSNLFTASGQQYSESFTTHDSSKPLRVTLAWTDAPGSTTGDSFVNNLDLQVEISGQTYKGNVFSGGLSTPGGNFDTKNNVENIFLPAGTNNIFTVTVTAANLAGDGVPGNTSPVDQDFALVVYNGDDYISGLKVVAKAGNPQRTPVNTAFPTPLTVEVRDALNNLTVGMPVTFTIQAGVSGASGTFSGNDSVTVNTNSDGIAVAPTLTANDTKGKFTVTAGIQGSANTATFVLVNTDTNNCGGDVVKDSNDDGTSSTCGTLSFALAEITTSSITFNLGAGHTINVTGDGFIFPLAQGVTVDGGNCADPVIVDGSGTNTGADGILMRGGTFKNLIIEHFKGRQIVAYAGPAHFSSSCVKAIK